MALNQNDLEALKRKTPPFWWPDVNAILQLFLTVAIVIMVGYILKQLLEGKAAFEAPQRDLLMVLFGIVLGCFKDVFGYTFGSSAGQKRQGEVITKSMEDKDKIIADNVTSTAALAANNTGTGGSTVDALKAATMVAPAAAAIAAPPAAAAVAPSAADVAAPPAAREAVADALAEQGITPKHPDHIDPNESPKPVT